MSFVRTVLGDVDPADLGPTYAHEHLVIDGGRAVEQSADLLLADVERLTTELRAAASAGLGTAIDAMPCDVGRNPAKLAALSRAAGVRIVAATGLHHERFYGPSHWHHRASVDELASSSPPTSRPGSTNGTTRVRLVRRTDHRAGVIKVAGSDGGPSARDRRVFEAAAIAHQATGVPILTHCEGGTGALEQIGLLASCGVDPRHVTVSHVDKVVDREYHREIAATGAFAVHDQGFRWGERPNGTLTLLGWAIEDGRIDQALLAMDAAKQGYYRAFGGSPGLDYLLTGFSAQMEERGIGGDVRRQLFVDNPARAFAFASRN